ncbi:MAG: VacJ family lipoprotein, partial [Caulobacter sp.]|nr:VacJ family lipoprotein [Caulobacter sp.]
LDRMAFGPIAHAYMTTTPGAVRNSVSAAVNNLGEPGTVLNDVVQGHPRRAGRATSRFAINSTLGVLGLFDVAAKMGLAYHDGDFAQTLGRYGVKSGPYLYIPVLGPSTFREGVGRVVDFMTDPVSLVLGGYTTTFGGTRLGVSALKARSNADPAFRALNDATDPYATVRSAYSQRRASLIREATGKLQALPDFDEAPSPR